MLNSERQNNEIMLYRTVKSDLHTDSKQRKGWTCMREDSCKLKAGVV